MTLDEFSALMEQWLAANGGRHNSAYSGTNIDSAVAKVINGFLLTAGDKTFKIIAETDGRIALQEV